jgi:hypothetical protein
MFYTFLYLAVANSKIAHGPDIVQTRLTSLCVNLLVTEVFWMVWFAQAQPGGLDMSNVGMLLALVEVFTTLHHRYISQKPRGPTDALTIQGEHPIIHLITHIVPFALVFWLCPFSAPSLIVATTIMIIFESLSNGLGVPSYSMFGSDHLLNYLVSP